MKEPEHPLRSLFAEALGIADPAERSAFLDRACGRHSQLRGELEDLLLAEARAGNFLPVKPASNSPRTAFERLAEASDTGGAVPIRTTNEKLGDRIGRYELLEKIGEGGCGVVYLAWQETPIRRQVALKVIKLGMDSKQVIARFEAERQALAIMDHPNIAKVFDAGVVGGSEQQEAEAALSDLRASTIGFGRPYFVMELVRGSKITDYCHQHRLSVRQRLDLFIQVCQAVQHAHQKGVIHRDLKPSNILVAVHDGVPVPKVIDFGIAKATAGKLTDETLFTAIEQFLGTPAYMSPEQAALTSVDVDTRSDIYSLGVLLYELLTGATPFDTKALLTLGVDELRQAIREKAPPRPSARLTQELTTIDSSTGERRKPISVRTEGAGGQPAKAKELVQQLRGDLDWIVMKCLEKDRARRYETPNALATDVTRHLNNEPILARPPSRLYEFQKTVRRHKTGFAATAAIIGVLCAGIVISSLQARRATRAEREAQAGSYTSDMNLCYQEWKDGNLANARALLRAYLPKLGQPDLRGFEWRYLWNLCRDESTQTVKFGPEDPIRQLASTPAHTFVVAACEKTIRLLEPSTGREMARLSYPSLEGTRTRPLVALAAGMTNLLAAHRANGLVTLWDLPRQKPLATLRLFTNSARVLALSPDGRYLAASDQDVHGFYGTVLGVWDLSARSETPPLVWSHPIEGGISAITFSPKGELLVTARASSKIVIESWATENGQDLQVIPNASAGVIESLCFSPDGSLLASAGVEGRIYVWDFPRRTIKFPLDGHSEVGSLVFSRDGEQLFSGGNDGVIRRWDMATQTSPRLWRLPGGGDSWIVVNPDGKRIVSATSQEVRIWDAEPRDDGDLIKVRPGWSWPIVSPDGKKVLVDDPDDLGGSNGVTVWDIASGQHLFDLASDHMVAKSMAFSPDGRLFAAGSLWKDGRMAVWKTADWEKGMPRVQPFAYLTNGFESACICFSPDGKILAAAGLSFPPDAPEEPSGASNRLAFWEVSSWKRLNLLPQAGTGATEWQAAVSVDFSGNGRLVAVGSRDGWVRLWDFKSQRLLKETSLLFSGNRWGTVVRFSPNSRWLASFRPGLPGVHLWDISNPQHPRTVWLGQEETAGQFWAVFAPDSKSLITASNDGLIKFWNLQSGRVALTLRHGHGPAGAVAIAPDNTFLVSKDANDIVKIWKTPSLEEIDRARTAP